MLDLAGKLVQEGRSEAQAMLDASSLVISEQQSRVSLPRRFWVPIKDIYLMQRRFMSRRGVRSARLLYHRRFRAGYDFLLLRSKHGEVGREIADWWTDVQRLEPEAQKKAFFIKGRRRK